MPLFIWIFVYVCINRSDSLVNLARNKPASQSSGSGVNPPMRCVDGDISQVWTDGSCCHTSTGAFRRSAWWQVDLEETAVIRQIKIYYREGMAQRFNGYTIHIIKSLDPLDSELCYKDPVDVLPPLTVSLNCSYTGRYVNMSVERLPGVTYKNYDGQGAIINHCELEVYGRTWFTSKSSLKPFYGGNITNFGQRLREPGCPLGKYGTDCQNLCPSSCKNESYICDPDSGNCAKGCKDGFMGLQCNVCMDGKFGENCDIRCPANCFSDTCNRANGDCTFGCKPNFTGSKCRDCKTGLYGNSCERYCSNGCINSVCERYGDCDCKMGFNGTKCEECSIGRYGNMCDKYCSIGCKNATCEQTSGTCNFGCVDKFVGDSCFDCINGRYGTDCQYNCPNNCKDAHCQRSSGTCVHGCTTGWKGDSCNVPTPSPMKQSSGLPIQMASIIGAAVIVLLVITIVIVAVIIFKKRKSK